MARLFTAVDLTDRARDALAARQADLARSLREVTRSTLRLVARQHLHLTLTFIGEVEEVRVAAIREAMSLDFEVPAFDLEFGGCGLFPPRGPARVLWIGITRGAQDVTALFERVSDRLERLGVPRERRPFSPHLTIGRWRDGETSRVRAGLPQVGPVAVQRVTAVTLFQSRLLPGGPEHTPVAEARLGGGPATAD